MNATSIDCATRIMADLARMLPSLEDAYKDIHAHPEAYAKARAEGRINELPVNHSPVFAPVIHPTLQAEMEAMIVGALAWLAK